MSTEYNRKYQLYSKNCKKYCEAIWAIKKLGGAKSISECLKTFPPHRQEYHIRKLGVYLTKMRLSLEDLYAMGYRNRGNELKSIDQL